jgi:hypothetical protein
VPAFWTDSVVDTIKTHFVAVSVQTQIVRNRKDAERDFLRNTLGPDFFPTSNGYMQCISASGRKLGEVGSPYGGDPKRALELFNQLPESERKPGAVKVPELEPDLAVALPAPPVNGLVLKCFGRFLTRDNGGSLRLANARDFPLMANFKPDQLIEAAYVFEAHTDFVWLTEAEWKSLNPENPKKGETLAVPTQITRRICRFHLIPERIYSGFGGWGPKGIRSADLTLTVDDASASAVRLRLGGNIQLGSVFDAAKATTPNGPLSIGYEPRIDGIVEYDLVKKVITRFEMVALGDVWGRMGDANDQSVSVERPGRHPLGFVFELVSADVPANRFVPAGHAARVRPGGVYWK